MTLVLALICAIFWCLIGYFIGRDSREINEVNEKIQTSHNNIANGIDNLKAHLADARKTIVKLKDENNDRKVAYEQLEKEYEDVKVDRDLYRYKLETLEYAVENFWHEFNEYKQEDNPIERPEISEFEGEASEANRPSVDKDYPV